MQELQGGRYINTHNPTPEFEVILQALDNSMKIRKIDELPYDHAKGDAWVYFLDSGDQVLRPDLPGYDYVKALLRESREGFIVRGRVGSGDMERLVIVVRVKKSSKSEFHVSCLTALEVISALGRMVLPPLKKMEEFCLSRNSAS